MAASCAICFGDRIAVALSVAVPERGASTAWLGEGRYLRLELTDPVDADLYAQYSFDGSMLEKEDLHILREQPCIRGMVSGV